MSTKQKFKKLLTNSINLDDLKALILIAHPDDEVVGMGSMLKHLKNMIIVNVTDGSPKDMIDAIASGCTSRQAYAKIRKIEMETALNMAGHKLLHCITLGFIDQETSLNLPGLSIRIVELIENLKPQIVLTHAYEGGHPDHDSIAFGVWAACRLLQKKNKQLPEIIEFASYHGDGSNQIITNKFIPMVNCKVIEIKLNDMEQNLKKQMIACYRSQKNTLSGFTVKYEQFRNVPFYDFSHLPHEGNLFYDFYQWGMDSSRWLQLANEAIRVLGLGENWK